jgi:hypothetical protein
MSSLKKGIQRHSNLVGVQSGPLRTGKLKCHGNGHIACMLHGR